MIQRIFSVDAETDGLYGLVWAIGVVVLEDGEVVDTFSGMIDPDLYVTDLWVRENIVPVVTEAPKRPRLYPTRRALLDAFWVFWLQNRETCLALADFGAPVEADLFRACVRLDPDMRTWHGPYPLHELGTALLLAGVDPDIDRREYAGRPDLVRHHPVDDALLAALCWQKAVSSSGQVEPVG